MCCMECRKLHCMRVKCCNFVADLPHTNTQMVSIVPYLNLMKTNGFLLKERVQIMDLSV